MRINDGRVVPAFISQALKNKPVPVFGRGTQTRSFCYVADLIEGIYRLMLSRYDLPVNLGNPAELTMVQFAEEIIRADEIQEQNRVQAAAAGRPETAQTGHRQGPKNPEVGTQGETGGWTHGHDCVFQNKSLSDLRFSIYASQHLRLVNCKS